MRNSRTELCCIFASLLAWSLLASGCSAGEGFIGAGGRDSKEEKLDFETSPTKATKSKSAAASEAFSSNQSEEEIDEFASMLPVPVCGVNLAPLDIDNAAGMKCEVEFAEDDARSGVVDCFALVRDGQENCIATRKRKSISIAWKEPVADDDLQVKFQDCHQSEDQLSQRCHATNIGPRLLVRVEAEISDFETGRTKFVAQDLDVASPNPDVTNAPTEPVIIDPTPVVTEHQFFVTLNSYLGVEFMLDLSRADAVCAREAQAVQVAAPAGTQWRALLGNGLTGVRERIELTGPVVHFKSGAVIARTAADFWDGKHEAGDGFFYSVSQAGATVRIDDGSGVFLGELEKVNSTARNCFQELIGVTALANLDSALDNPSGTDRISCAMTRRLACIASSVVPLAASGPKAP